MYYPEKDIIFAPERHPNYLEYSKEARNYILNTSNEQVRTYFKAQYPNFDQNSLREQFRAIAENDIGPNPTDQQIDFIMRQEANQHY